MANTSATIKVLHYNIKELDSTRLSSSQMDAVKKIVSLFSPDIVSINELQYDLPGVPNSAHNSTAQNLSKLRDKVGFEALKYQSFYPANTGKNARKKADGTYYLKADSTEARSHADQVNFGVFPAQYSTGAFFKYKKINEIIISGLKWKNFNPRVDFSKYKLANGDSIPDDIELFDKNFSDITVEVDGKEVHIVLLHTVPSYHFGNKYSINDLRNAEQLRFLEWYLTGKTDYVVGPKKIKPLKKDAHFIAMGDLNVSLFDKESEGQKVLEKIFNKTKPWISSQKMTFTNESSSFEPKPFRLLLDYIVVSKNIEIKRGEIVHPKFERDELGCKPQKGPGVRKYKKDGKTCYVRLGEEYDIFKQASDHYPIYGEFELK